MPTYQQVVAKLPSIGLDHPLIHQEMIETVGLIERMDASIARVEAIYKDASAHLDQADGFLVSYKQSADTRMSNGSMTQEAFDKELEFLVKTRTEIHKKTQEAETMLVSQRYRQVLLMDYVIELYRRLV
jgi:hypothetical protein